MAVDVHVSRPETSALPLGLARLVAIPAQFLLAGLVAASFAFRFVAALGHATPLYFADEYIYSSLARSLAQTGRPLIRHGPAHFPALLEPLLAAPFWLVHDPAVAYRLTQAENALAMSLAAIPAYLIARRLRLGTGPALAAAALAVVSPDLFFSSFILADPIAYPLVLAALYAGICTIYRPTRRSQLAFAALAALATFARVQYVFLPVALLGAALIVERGSVPRVVRRFRLSLGLFAAPLVALVALGPTRSLGYYSTLAHAQVGPASLLHWIGTDAMLLAYSAGWVLVPGALVGLGYGLVRPRTRDEAAFAALTVTITACLFAETSLYAANGSGRFQERYLMVLLPLVWPAFCLYLKRGRPARLATCLAAVALLALAAKVPLSGYTVGDGKQDSPFLFAVFWLEKSVGVGNGSLAVAALAALLSCLAAAIAFRARLAAVALLATVVVSSGAALGAVKFDQLVASSVRSAYLPPDERWVDHAHVGNVILLQTPATPHVRAHEQLFWNNSLDDVLFLAGASPIDPFRAEHVQISADGRILLHRRVLRTPLAISNYAVNVQLSGARRVARGGTYDLWQPQGTPRFSVFTGGLYYDRWLADAGHITVWPDSSGWVRGTLRLVLSLPTGTERTPLRFAAPGITRKLRISPGETRVLELHVSKRGPFTLGFRTSRPGYLRDRRAISVQAAAPTFTRLRPRVATGQLA